MRRDDGKIGRRRFCALSAGAALTGAAVSQAHGVPRLPAKKEEAAEPTIRKCNRLGRTGFNVSDIALGFTRISDPDVVRYAFDHGVNLFDTAEAYGSGKAERIIGQAMPHLDRKNLFIVTKLVLKRKESKESIVRRLGKCLERLKTGYVDALYMHSVKDLATINHAGFHQAVKELRAAGKVRFCGISSHGPKGKKGDSMERVLCAAAEDGRFDLMLLVYNHLNAAPGEKILAACKAKQVGATLMKVSPAVVKLPPVIDPKALTRGQQAIVEIMARRKGVDHARATANLVERFAKKRAELLKKKAKIDAFIARHQTKNRAQLAWKSVQWALRNPDAHCVCVSMNSFDMVNEYVSLSGRPLSFLGARALHRHAAAEGAGHCRVGCAACADACPRALPVSTIMRYTYYFQQQRRQEHAMQKYAAISDGDDLCRGCDGSPCRGACPHGVDVQLQLAFAHRMLSHS